ncbi:hypothetical protein AB0K51_29135 [Kitasatospora sp. NPDC049285]|uniref:hypothetical protein n=1 Tax=Kitasatospora sp. NPDC049285 TaxID=3157096 RepID=UPI00344871C9
MEGVGDAGVVEGDGGDRLPGGAVERAEEFGPHRRVGVDTVAGEFGAQVVLEGGGGGGGAGGPVGAVGVVAAGDPDHRHRLSGVVTAYQFRGEAAGGVRDDPVHGRFDGAGAAGEGDVHGCEGQRQGGVGAAGLRVQWLWRVVVRGADGGCHG